MVCRVVIWNVEEYYGEEYNGMQVNPYGRFLPLTICCYISLRWVCAPSRGAGNHFLSFLFFHAILALARDILLSYCYSFSYRYAVVNPPVEKRHTLRYVPLHSSTLHYTFSLHTDLPQLHSWRQHHRLEVILALSLRYSRLPLYITSHLFSHRLNADALGLSCLALIRTPLPSMLSSVLHYIPSLTSHRC